MKHFLTQGNITDPKVDQNIKLNFPNGIDFCYTDPPWGNGNLKYWDTINKKMTGDSVSQINQDTLENRTVDLICEHVNNYAFIVYGVREANSIIAKLKQKPNVIDIQYYEKTYKSGAKDMKNCVITVTLNKAPIIDFSFLEGEKGLNGLKLICEKFKDTYKTALDLFVGIGYYLKMLDGYGFVVVGNELNSLRIQKAISKVKSE
jgi:hypothetical protein